MKIYLDVFFLVNTEMNFVVLVLQSMIQKKRFRLIRLVSTSALGGIFAIWFLLSGMHQHRLFSFFWYAVDSAVLVRLAFGKTTISTWGRNVVVYYFSSFFLAGFLQYLQNILPWQGKMAVLLSGAGVALYIVYRSLPCMKSMENKASNYWRIRLGYHDKEIHGVGLMDTGNRLADPFSGRPVILSGRDFVTPLWKEDPPLFRYIPYHSIGVEHGTLPAFQADYIEFGREQGNWIRREKPWIAVCDGELSADEEYEVILHPDIVKELFINNF